MRGSNVAALVGCVVLVGCGRATDDGAAGASTLADSGCATVCGPAETGVSESTAATAPSGSSSGGLGSTDETGFGTTGETASSSTTGDPLMPSSTRHTPIQASRTDAPQGFWEYLPPAYGEGDPAPLMVFWHGIGENGNGEDELAKVPNNGPPRLIESDAWPNERPFVVLSPQHAGGGCPGPNEIDAFITWAVASYAIDPDRVYLTGLSCGAIGSWNYLGVYRAEAVAAAVLIAGDGRSAVNNAGCELGQVPIWAFHGDADTIVDVNGTVVPVTELLACTPTPDVAMTIYPGVGHDSWSRTYDLSAGHDIYAWLLEHTH